jgi:transposase InsO family protein
MALQRWQPQSGLIRTPPAPCHRNSSFKVLRRPFEPSQYTSIEFGHRCRDAGVRPSMGSVGDAYDNAMCESFFATLECELFARLPVQDTGRGAQCDVRLHRITPTMPAAMAAARSTQEMVM